MKIHTAIELLKILKRANGHIVTLTSLAGSLDVSLRTISRVLEELICCGCPIDILRGRHGGVKLVGDFL